MTLATDKTKTLVEQLGQAVDDLLAKTAYAQDQTVEADRLRHQVRSLKGQLRFAQRQEKKSGGATEPPLPSPTSQHNPRDLMHLIKDVLEMSMEGLTNFSLAFSEAITKSTCTLTLKNDTDHTVHVALARKSSHKFWWSMGWWTIAPRSDVIPKSLLPFFVGETICYYAHSSGAATWEGEHSRHWISDEVFAWNNSDGAESPGADCRLVGMRSIQLTQQDFSLRLYIQ